MKIGIGLNTGICCVGNLGTETRFDYSVIGDNVNVASRLEGQSKTYDVGTIVGESTTMRAPDFAFLELDFLKMKGKTEATRIYALLGQQRAESVARLHRSLGPPRRDCCGATAPRTGTAPTTLGRECDALHMARPRSGFMRSTASVSIIFGRIRRRPNWDGTAEALSK